MSTKEDVRAEPTTKPPTRWRNRWIHVHKTASNGFCKCGKFAGVKKQGDVYMGHCKTYPSLDAAHTSAREEMQRDVVVYGCVIAVWDGAVPVDEDQ